MPFGDLRRTPRDVSALMVLSIPSIPSSMMSRNKTERDDFLGSLNERKKRSLQKPIMKILTLLCGTP